MIQVRQLKTEAERAQAFNLRYRVYIEEMKRGTKSPDHSRKMVLDQMDESGLIFGAFEDERLVGTSRVNLVGEGHIDHEDLYEIEEFSQFCFGKIAIAGKLIVDPDYRGTHVCIALMKAMFVFGQTRNVEVWLLDCNKPLDRLYSRVGFVPYRTANHPEYGNVICMMMFPNDRQHHEKVGSPLRELIGQDRWKAPLVA
jgi:predicted GNAT family N-acyltransferase